LSPNDKLKPSNLKDATSEEDSSSSSLQNDVDMDTDTRDTDTRDYSTDSDDNSEHDSLEDLDVSQNSYSGVPLILPRQRFAGARNIATIKDGELNMVAFLVHKLTSGRTSQFSGP
jgi:WD repeat-containing protein 42A